LQKSSSESNSTVKKRSLQNGFFMDDVVLKKFFIAGKFCMKAKMKNI
jgi:hypothetical protein